MVTSYTMAEILDDNFTNVRVLSVQLNIFCRNNVKTSGSPSQLTIFYAGTVNVYNDISPEKVPPLPVSPTSHTHMHASMNTYRHALFLVVNLLLGHR